MSIYREKIQLNLGRISKKETKNVPELTTKASKHLGSTVGALRAIQLDLICCFALSAMYCARRT
jgi:hypothetical protein